MANTKRHDPPSRTVDGAITDVCHIANRDPERVYFLANPNDFYCGVAEMERQGCVVETHRKDGPRVVGGKVSADGDAVTMFGQVLMSRSRAEDAEYQARKHGVADMRSRAIGQKGGVDAVRGDNGRLAEFSQDPGEYVERMKS